MEGKVIGITGGASGIGLATAKLLSSRKATVCIADSDPTALAAAEKEFSSYGLPYFVQKVDVTVRSEVDSWVDGIVEKFGRLGIFVPYDSIIANFH